MFSMCSELTPRARIADTRIPQLMQPWCKCVPPSFFGVFPDVKSQNKKVSKMPKKLSYLLATFLFIWGCCPLRNAITDRVGGLKTKKVKKTLSTAQWAQGIQCFDSINNFISEQRFKQSLKSWSNFNLVFFGYG